MDKDFADLLGNIRSRADKATTTAQLIRLDPDIEVAARALELRTALLENKLIRHQGAVALGYRQVNETTLGQQAHDSVEQ
jgi:hypothetical protein